MGEERDRDDRTTAVSKELVQGKRWWGVFGGGGGGEGRLVEGGGRGEVG